MAERLAVLLLVAVPTLIVGPAVPPASFVTVGDGELVGGGEGSPACCEGSSLTSCKSAEISQAVLGQEGGSIALPGDIVVTYVGHIAADVNSFQYESPDGSSATITCGSADNDEGEGEDEEAEDQRGCHGQARNAGGQVFVLEYCGAEGHVWKEPNLKDFNEAEEENDVEDFIWDQELDPVQETEDESLVGKRVLGQTKAAKYSIKFYYTSQFKAATPDINGFISQAIAEINQGYANSQVPLSAYPLCSELASSIADGGDAVATLNAFAALKGTIANLRDTADAAVLLVNSLGGNICGIGRLNAVVSGSTVTVVRKDCALGYYSIGHELGHNIGMLHDPANAGLSVSTYAYPYATGHLIAKGTSKDPNGFRTIMAYAAPGHYTRVNYYSSPAVRFAPTGTMVGTATSDNRRLLQLNGQKMAGIGNESSRTCRPGARFKLVAGGAPDVNDEESGDE